MSDEADSFVIWALGGIVLLAVSMTIMYTDVAIKVISVAIIGILIFAMVIVFPLIVGMLIVDIADRIFRRL